MDAKQLRKRLAQLRSTIEQGEFAPDDECGLLDQIFDEGELDDIEEQYPTLFNALIRCDEDYGRVVEASSHLTCSLDAVTALGTLAEAPGRRATADDSDGDPDAELDPERN